MSTFTLALVLCVLVPFALWGDALDRAAPSWLTAPNSLVLVASLGIALLVADVVLPIPSSVVGMALCWTLGPFWGGVSMAIGLTLSFAMGYALGRLLPEQHLRIWVGTVLWDRVRKRAHRQTLWWIVASRPLPLLAEMSALMAGVWRVPAGPALMIAALSSCVVASLYATSAWLGRNAPHTALTFVAMLTLPIFTWAVHKMTVQRMGKLVLPWAAGGLLIALNPPPAKAADIATAESVDQRDANAENLGGRSSTALAGATDHRAGWRYAQASRLCEAHDWGPQCSD